MGIPHIADVTPAGGMHRDRYFRLRQAKELTYIPGDNLGDEHESDGTSDSTNGQHVVARPPCTGGIAHYGSEASDGLLPYFKRSCAAWVRRALLEAQLEIS